MIFPYFFSQLGIINTVIYMSIVALLQYYMDNLIYLASHYASSSNFIETGNLLINQSELSSWKSII